MAVTSIWSIKGRVDKVIAYAVNPEKTGEAHLQETADLHVIDKVIEYTANDLKTEQRMYVSGLNCEPDQAARQFQRSKQHWDKEGGIVAFHGYQSFKPGEVDAETAHSIGVALAEELWGDRFEVVVATHLNTGHYHNHFVINSVSFRDGYRYYDTKETYQRMRDVSDRLCREHQLSVIKNPGHSSKHYSEWAAEKNGKPTMRGMIRTDIDRAIAASTTERDFIRVMTEMGYTIKTRTETGKPLKYPSVSPPGAKGNFRLHKLGEGYALDDIKERILQNIRKKVPFPEATIQHRGRYRYKGSFRHHRKATGLRALYFYYCYKLGIIKKRPASVKRVPVALREDIIQLDKRIAETRFLGANQIETLDALVEKQQAVENTICVLTDNRKDLRNALKRATRKGDDAEIALLKEQIASLSAELKQCHREVKLCKSIAERSGVIKENLEQLIHQQNLERKEKTDYEHSRRRSGTDRPNVTQWR